MKRRFKQAVSTVLVTLMALQPLGSFSAVAATQYDPDYVDEIIDEDEEWEESTFFSARTATDANASVTSVAVTSNAPSGGVSVGEEVTITAKVTPASGSNWSTATNSNAREITINSHGLFEEEPADIVDGTTITFTGEVSGEPGTYTVDVTVNGVSGSTRVVVKEKDEEPTPDDEIKGSFNKKISRILKGGTDTATLILEGDGDISKVTYMAGKEEVATVSGDENGNITIEAVEIGETQIYAMNGNETIATMAVEVDDVDALIPSSDYLVVETGKKVTTTLSAIFALSEGVWSISDIHEDDIDVKVSPGNVVEPAYDGEGTLTVTAGETVGTATIAVFYKTVEKATITVEVVEPVENPAVEPDAPVVDITGVTPEYNLPADAPAELKEQADTVMNEALQEISNNTAIGAANATTINLRGKKPSDFNPEIPDVDGVVYPVQKVESVEMGYVQTENGYEPFVKKVSFDISLYWKPVSQAGKNVKGMPLYDVTGRHTFRIPVPTNIGDNRYANVKHDGENAGQKSINKENAGNFFITITVTHFSTFELEFTNQRISTGGSSGGGGGGGGGSRTYSGGVANLVGNWILDANQRWWFSLTGGGYPANNWGRINNKWYYFGADGYMMTGWLNLAGKWYFLQPAGDMIENNWYLYNNQWYYLGSDGAMLTNQWVSHNNQWYYMNADGTMAVNTTTPDGYTVDANGVWVQ